MTRYFNDYKCIDMSRDEYLEHFGILGQKWGIRRYQNKDGSLTAAGKERYSKKTEALVNKLEEKHNIITMVMQANAKAQTDSDMKYKYNEEYDETWEGKNAGSHDNPEYSAGKKKLYNDVFGANMSWERYRDIAQDPNYKKLKKIAEEKGQGALSENATKFIEYTEKLHEQSDHDTRFKYLDDYVPEYQYKSSNDMQKNYKKYIKDLIDNHDISAFLDNHEPYITPSGETITFDTLMENDDMLNYYNEYITDTSRKRK